MSLTLYPRLSQILQENPELSRYRRTLIGHCCRKPSDKVLQDRIRVFLVKLPRFGELLEPLLH